jgi:hypothetical protein
MTFLVYTILSRNKNAGPPCRTNEQKKFLISGTYVYQSISLCLYDVCLKSDGQQKREERKPYSDQLPYKEENETASKRVWGGPEVFLNFLVN